MNMSLGAKRTLLGKEEGPELLHLTPVWMCRKFPGSESRVAGMQHRGVI